MLSRILFDGFVLEGMGRLEQSLVVLKAISRFVSGGTQSGGRT